MYKSLILIAAILVPGASCVLAQSQSAVTDPVLVSPTMYTMLLENEHVRVVEYQIGPGEKDNWHTHPAKASYVVSGGSLRITTEEGESFTVDEEVGSSTWFGAVGRHYGENVGKTTVRIVFVEIKEIDAGKEDLSKYQN
jgi:quercetin dioxygenase-like cupin family protein